MNHSGSSRLEDGAYRRFTTGLYCMLRTSHSMKRMEKVQCAIFVCPVSATVREGVRAGQLGLATPRKWKARRELNPHSLVRSE